MRKINNKKKKNDIKEKFNFTKKKQDKITDTKENEILNEETNIKKKKLILNKEKKKVEIKKDKQNNKLSKQRKNTNNKRKIKKKNNNKTKRKFWKKLVTAFLILCIIGVLAVAAFFSYIVLSSPTFDESAFDVKDQSIVYDLNGDIIAKLGVEKRESVTYDELPQVLIDAIIAVEDSRFFQHNGVDLPRFLKASIYQVLGRSDAGGASTLTMQLVKNSLTSTVDEGIKGIIRKFQDVYLSVFKVEKNYSKEEIIELYVNNHYLGASVYGVEEASKYYFGKSVSELTLPEAAIIAGLFQAPQRHNPYRNIESATSRRNTVLNLMVRHGYIKEEEAQAAKDIEISSLLIGTTENQNYQAYIDKVIEETIELTGKNPNVVPMKIYTTMEVKMQEGLNKIMNNDKWYWKTDETQAGIAIVNVKTGAIAALSPARNKSGELIFSYATDAYRQPGSTAKPIFAYGPGFEYNNYSTYTLFTDEAWTYTNGPSVNNWDGDFDGLVTTRYALQYSRNIPALKSYQNIGSKKIQQFAYSLGLDVALHEESENYRVLSTGLDNVINEAYSIGGTAEGFTPLMMASAYSAFASGGYYTDPYSITKIEFRETGEVIEYKTTKTRVMKDSTAYLMNNILESAVEVGFNGGARVYGSHVAAKTGTTNFDEATLKKYNLPETAVNDLWTIAYTSEYVVAVWYGYDSAEAGYSVNTDGRKEALVSDVMKYIPKDTKGWTKPSSVVAVQVEKETYPAKLPSEYTPENMITTEYFIRGTQPTEVSERYAQLPNITNTNVETNNNTITITWDYTTPTVLTDEYITKYFNHSVYGNSKKEFIEDRKKYNEEKLGEIGFSIYKEHADGTLELLGFTKEHSYTYTGYESVSLIIKAEHTVYKSNASTGTKFNLTINTGGTSANLIATLNGKLIVDTSIGTYQESGIQNVFYGMENVTSLATYKYQIINQAEITEYLTENDLVTAINLLPAGTYKINYIIKYKDKELIKNRTVILNSKD